MGIAMVCAGLGVAIPQAHAVVLSDGDSSLDATVLPAGMLVAKHDVASGLSAIQVRAGRGEREPALLVIRPDADGLLTVTPTALIGPSGSISPEIIKLESGGV